MCCYFSKSEDKCSFDMKQAAHEAFDTKLDQFNTMKNILKTYIIIEKVLLRSLFIIFCQNCV